MSFSAVANLTYKSMLLVHRDDCWRALELDVRVEVLEHVDYEVAKYWLKMFACTL